MHPRRRYTLIHTVHLSLPVWGLLKFRVEVQQRPGPEHAIASQLQLVHGVNVQYVESVMGIPIQTDSNSDSDSDGLRFGFRFTFGCKIVLVSWEHRS